MNVAEATRELALRLLAPREMPDPTWTPVRLLVGELPAELANDLPLPDGCRVLGSLVRGQSSVAVELDTDLPPDEVLRFYQERLTAAGWRKIEPLGMQGGFGVGLSVGQQVMFCRSKRGPALTVWASADSGEPTQVRLDIQRDGRYSPCAHTERMDDPFSMLPELGPPANAQQFPSGGGGGGDSVYSSAQLTSDLDVAAIAAHYTGQLEAAGWTRQAEGQDGPLAWSTWTFQDQGGEHWQGVFFALRTSDQPSNYMLQVHAQWPDAKNTLPGPLGMAWRIG